MSELLPANVPAEEAVIGSILIYTPSFVEASKHIVGSDFYIERNRWIWDAVDKLIKDHVNVDILTVTTALESQHKLESIGGQTYMIDLIQNTPSAMNAEHYAKIVADCAKRRRMIKLANDLAQQAFDEKKDLDQYIPVHMSELLKTLSTENKTEHITTGLSELYDDIEKRAADPKDVYGITTGIAGIDRITGGMQKGELFLLSGEPSVGKSLLAMQISFSMAKDGHPGTIYEIEMSKKQVLRRQLSIESNVHVRGMKTGRITEEQMTQIIDGMGKMEALPIYLSDSTSWNTSSLRSDLTRLKQLHGIEWFVVDYLRLLKDRFEGKEPERIGVITSNLHDICRDLDMAGIAIQSMTKAGFSEGGMAGVYGGSELHHAVDTMAIMTANEAKAGSAEIVDLKFEKVREGEDNVRLVKLVKKPGFPAFAEMERIQ